MEQVSEVVVEGDQFVYARYPTHFSWKGKPVRVRRVIAARSLVQNGVALWSLFRIIAGDGWRRWLYQDKTGWYILDEDDPLIKKFMNSS